MADIQITVSGPVTINQVDPDDINGPVLDRIAALEALMTQISDFLTDEGVKMDVVVAGLGDIAADVAVLLTKASQVGAFTPEEQAMADANTAKLTAIHSALSDLNDQVGDQDGSDTPTEPTA